MKSLFDGLLDWGVPESRIHYEFFGPASVLKDRAKVSTPKRAAQVSQCCEDVEVTFSKSGVKTNWNPSFESILDLAEANGLSPITVAGPVSVTPASVRSRKVRWITFKNHWNSPIREPYSFAAQSRRRTL